MRRVVRWSVFSAMGLGAMSALGVAAFSLSIPRGEMIVDGIPERLVSVDVATSAPEPERLIPTLGELEAEDDEGIEEVKPEPAPEPVAKKKADHVSESAGVLSALRDAGDLDGVFGSSGLDAGLTGGIGGLIGAKGTVIGSGGLGSRGRGLGGGGSVGYGSGRVVHHGGSDRAAPIPRAAPAPRAVTRARPTLRAGMTDDNMDFEKYLGSLRGAPARGTVRLKVDDRRWITVLDAAGNPVPDARVDVLDRKRDEVVWRGRTYGDGTTAFYPDQVGIRGDMLVQVRGAGDYQALRWDGEQDMRIELDRLANLDDRVAIDVALIIDTTGSMGDEIDQIKATLLAVASEVEHMQRPVDLRWGAVLYRDRGDAYVTRKIAFDGDMESFEKEIRRVRANGGGDGPESLNAGVRKAVNGLEWRRGAARIGFLIADAEPHMDYQDIDYAQTSQEALEDGIKIHTVAASGLNAVGSAVFRQIAQLTRGKFIFIEYGSLDASARSHGVSGRVAGNNLDRILFERIEEEVENYGELPDGIAGFGG